MVVSSHEGCTTAAAQNLSSHQQWRGNSRSCLNGEACEKESLIEPYTRPHIHTEVQKCHRFSYFRTQLLILLCYIASWFTHMKRAILIVGPFWISNLHHYICYSLCDPFDISIFLWQELVAEVIRLFDKFYVLPLHLLSF